MLNSYRKGNPRDIYKSLMCVEETAPLFNVGVCWPVEQKQLPRMKPPVKSLNPSILIWSPMDIKILDKKIRQIYWVITSDALKQYSGNSITEQQYKILLEFADALSKTCNKILKK